MSLSSLIGPHRHPISINYKSFLVASRLTINVSHKIRIDYQIIA